MAVLSPGVCGTALMVRGVVESGAAVTSCEWQALMVA